MSRISLIFKKICKRTTVLSIVSIMVMFVFFVPSNSFAGTISRPPYRLFLIQNLQGHWTMDGPDTPWTSSTAATTLDRSGNSRTGTLNSFEQATSTVPGKIGQAISFSGSNYISTVNAVSTFITASAGTISVWFYANAGNGGTCADGTVSPFFGDANGGGYVWFGYDGTNICAGAYDGGLQTVTSSASTGQWVHAVWVHRGGNLYLYKNGVEAGSASLGDISDLTNSVWFGRSSDDTYFNGRLDDLRVYNTALSASEITQLYNFGRSSRSITPKGLPGESLNVGLIGWWTFDGPDMTSYVADRSGQDKRGYIVGQSSSGTTTVAGVLGQAFVSDGSDDYVNVGANTDFNFGSSDSFSVTAWIKPRKEYATTKGFLGKFSSFGSSGYVFFHLNDSTSYLYARLRDTSGNDTSYVANGAFPGTQYINDGNWHHIAMVIDRTAQRMYLYTDTYIYNSSGTNISSFGDLTNNGYTFRIGSSVSGPMPSAYDDVRVYNRALSAAEIMKLYKMGR